MLNADHRAVNAVLTARLQQVAVGQTALRRGADLLSGFMKRFPRCRGRLAEAWHAYSVWSRVSPRITCFGLEYVLLRPAIAVCVIWGWCLRRSRPLSLACSGRASLRR